MNQDFQQGFLPPTQQYYTLNVPRMYPPQPNQIGHPEYCDLHPMEYINTLSPAPNGPTWSSNVNGYWIQNQIPYGHSTSLPNPPNLHSSVSDQNVNFESIGNAEEKASTNVVHAENVQPRFFTGYVTSLEGDIGVIDKEVFFHASAVKGPLKPKIGDYVLGKAESLKTMPGVKWNAKEVQVLDKTFSSITTDQIQPILPESSSVPKAKSSKESEDNLKHSGTKLSEKKSEPRTVSSSRSGDSKSDTRKRKSNGDHSSGNERSGRSSKRNDNGRGHRSHSKDREFSRKRSEETKKLEKPKRSKECRSEEPKKSNRPVDDSKSRREKETPILRKVSQGVGSRSRTSIEINFPNEFARKSSSARNLTKTTKTHESSKSNKTVQGQVLVTNSNLIQNTESVPENVLSEISKECGAETPEISPVITKITCDVQNPEEKMVESSPPVESTEPSNTEEKEKFYQSLIFGNKLCPPTNASGTGVIQNPENEQSVTQNSAKGRIVPLGTVAIKKEKIDECKNKLVEKQSDTNSLKVPVIKIKSEKTDPLPLPDEDGSSTIVEQPVCAGRCASEENECNNDLKVIDPVVAKIDNIGIPSLTLQTPISDKIQSDKNNSDSNPIKDTEGVINSQTENSPTPGTEPSDQSHKNGLKADSNLNSQEPPKINSSNTANLNEAQLKYHNDLVRRIESNMEKLSNDPNPRRSIRDPKNSKSKRSNSPARRKGSNSKAPIGRSRSQERRLTRMIRKMERRSKASRLRASRRSRVERSLPRDRTYESTNQDYQSNSYEPGSQPRYGDDGRYEYDAPNSGYPIDERQMGSSGNNHPAYQEFNDAPTEILEFNSNDGPAIFDYNHNDGQAFWEYNDERPVLRNPREDEMPSLRWSPPHPHFTPALMKEQRFFSGNCSSCGKYGHEGNDCWHRRELETGQCRHCGLMHDGDCRRKHDRCLICHKIGHLKKVCRNRLRYRS